MRIFAGYNAGQKLTNAGVEPPEGAQPLQGAGQSDAATSGFTLVEVLIAMTILAIGILGVASLTGTALRTSAYSQALSQASNLAEDRMESLRSVAYANIQVSDTATARTDLSRNCIGAAPTFTCTPTNTISVQWSASDTSAAGKMVYTWTYVVTYLDIDGDGTPTPNDGAKRIDLTVSWRDHLFNVTKSVTLTTLIAR